MYKGREDKWWGRPEGRNCTLVYVGALASKRQIKFQRRPSCDDRQGRRSIDWNFAGLERVSGCQGITQWPGHQQALLRIEVYLQ
nr:hypothetical protein CFP56_22546 [Quercus suber]